MLSVVIRTDASLYIGSGHVMRCLVLAEALKNADYDVTFVCRELPGNLINFIAKKSIKVVVLSKPYRQLEVRHSADYTAWLQVSWQEDINEFLSLIKSADLVVTDHYAIDKKWEKRVKYSLNCKVLAIDDLDRDHESDLIIDQNLWPDMVSRYRNCSGIKLLGPSYALLRPSFSLLRKKQIEKKNQLLAFFGGSDLTRECIKLVKAAISIGPLPFELKVVAGLGNHDYQELLTLAEGSDIVVEQFIDNFDLELKQSNYVIGASGVSNWERFCLEVPSTIVSVADNQKIISEYLYNLGVVRYLGSSCSTCVDSYLSELLYLRSCWPHFGRCKLLNVDGLGVIRTIEIIKKELLND
tara:strand:- start:13002 stop:14063 length:1062 start_codon:yes stop_codon:yes gene_type:complete